jgi:hypothetical protein
LASSRRTSQRAANGNTRIWARRSRRIKVCERGQFDLLRESQLKVLLPERLLCFAAECGSAQRNVLQDVIVQLAKNAQLLA